MKTSSLPLRSPRGDSGPARRPRWRIVAHRGNHDTNTAPENSLAAVQAAWRTGPDAVEIDVRLTADERLVIIHDGSTGPVADLDMIVSNCRLDELRRLTMLGRDRAQAPGFRIATFDEIAATMPDGGSLYVDVKEGPAKADRLIARFKKRALAPERFLFIGFDACVMAAFKKAFPRHTSFLLFEAAAMPGAIDAALAAGMDGIDIEVAAGVDAAFVNKAGSAGLQVHAWGVNTPAAAAAMRASGVAGMTTDRPAWLRKYLNRELMIEN
jgi:glycerophosphoryl diester phosphodiesterase